MVRPVIEKDVFVDFVGDKQEIVLFAEIGDEVELIFGEYFARWVVWGVEDEDACAGYGCCEFFTIQIPGSSVRIFSKGDVSGLETKEVCLGGVHFVKGLEDDNAISGFTDGAEDRREGFGSAEGDGDLSFRVGAQTVETCGVVCNGFAQFGQAKGVRVLAESVLGVVQAG